MINDFACKETEKIWHGTRSKKLPGNIQNIARRKLRMLHNAKSLNDLTIPPNNRLEALRGNKKGLYSIRVNKQWRITFTWNDGMVNKVAIEDYH